MQQKKRRKATGPEASINPGWTVWNHRFDLQELLLAGVATNNGKTEATVRLQ